MPDPTPPVTPDQAAQASAAKLIAEQDAAKVSAYKESIDGIVDPGRPPPPPETTSEPSKSAPQLVSGASVHSEDLLDRAAAVDITEAEAKEYTPTQLAKVVGRLEQTSYEPEPTQQGPSAQEVAEWHQYQEWRRQQQQASQGLPSLGKPSPNPDGSEGEWDPALVAAFEARDRYYQSILAQQQQQLQQAHQATQQTQHALYQREVQRATQALDGLIAKDAEYEDVLGKGTVQEVQGTRHQATRQRLGVRMDSIAAEYQQAGIPAPPVEAIYEEARNSLFGSRAQQKAEAGIAERARNAHGQFLGRPTATERNGDLKPGVDKATKSVAQLMMKQGRLGVSYS